MKATKNDKVASELKLEIDSLRQEQLVKAKVLPEKLAEKEACLEQLNIDLEAAKTAESYARTIVEELNGRVVDLAAQADKAKGLERSSSEYLASVLKQLEISNASYHDAEVEIASLKEKVGFLEISIGQCERDQEESDHLIELAREETSEMVKRVESLTSDLESLKDEKSQAVNSEQIAASSLRTLLGGQSKLMNELEISRAEEEKSKKALESLESALQEVSLEARATRENLFSLHIQCEKYETQIKDLNLVLETVNEKYESTVDDAKREIDALKELVKQRELDCQKVKVEWEQKELRLIDSVKKSEEECYSMQNERNRLISLIKMTEKEGCSLKEEEDGWKNSFKEMEAEVISLKEVLTKTDAEGVELKRNLTEREHEMQNILLENEVLQNREAASMKKVEALTKMLEEALTEVGQKNKEITAGEKDYDVEVSKQSGKGDKKPMADIEPQRTEKLRMDKLTEVIKIANDQPVQKGFVVNRTNVEATEFADKEKDNGECAEIDLKMWESRKIEVKNYPLEEMAELQSSKDEQDPKVESADRHNQVNGLSSTENLDKGGFPPSKKNTHKRKNPLLQRFGNLLKKKGTTNKK